jgi:prepilin-type N-terminal cleavage/methylation domain-containing protein
MKSLQKVDGFTLLEVLVAFSLLAILLTVIIQSQGETVYFLEKTHKLSIVQKEVINELLKTERLYSKETISAGDGVFDDDHVLAGDRWQREVTQEDFMGIVPVMKITYRIYWRPKVDAEEQSFEASILGEVK